MISLDHVAPAKSNTTKMTKRKILIITISFAFVIIASGITWVPQNSLIQLFHPGTELEILFALRGSTVERKLKVNFIQPGIWHSKSTMLNYKNTAMV